MVTGGLSPFVLRNVVAFIEENLAQPLTLADLASQAALSEYHFARMFRQSMGQAPHQYVMHRRMEKAKALIQHTAMPLTDIAMACGFNSASHFSNRFRSVLGVTPSQLRATKV
ncbi:AraC family transcriptional regulator [Enterobacter cancerogenus]|uniref:AraC family transcriptional regulator n=1 Tax=Enterobacter cancerogenus TaxID=69218 RepID=A0A484XH48_9ENTR|nr:AraC family transcriptional regulator [Enterobacter cancerogenus]